jgi:hypothetical protein
MVTLPRCSPQALALYVLLVCASDAQGLIYYSEPRIAHLLTLEPTTVTLARRELIGLGLIAYQKPLYQLLSLEGELTVGKSPTPLIWGPPREQQSPVNSELQPAPAIYFGESTRRAMHDNLKTAVLERIPGYAPVFNPRYLDFAAHYGFKPVACNVGRGNEKGRVENAIGYIQKNFLGGLEISSLEALNAPAHRWMEQVANVRFHRETGKRPCDAFKEEKPTLQPLAISRREL